MSVSTPRKPMPPWYWRIRHERMYRDGWMIAALRSVINDNYTLRDQIAALQADRPEGDVCALCHAVATGHAFIGDDRYCHGDDDLSPTCYERAAYERANATIIDATARWHANRAHPETWSEDE